MNLTYNGKKAKLDGNHLFVKLQESKKVIHISDIQKEFSDALNFVKMDPANANMDSDKLFELQEILENYRKL